MKKIRRGLCLLLVLVCLTAWLPQPAAAACAELPDSLYLTQLVSGTCTLSSAAMMLRAMLYINNNDNWGQVTETSLRPTAWMNGVGLRWSFTHKVEGASISVSHASASGVSISGLKALLDKHPEGIVLYCGKLPHAVFLVGYQDDIFYCADTVSGYSEALIPLTASWLGTKYGSQANILRNVTAYWYVSDYSDPHGGSNCDCQKSYAGTYVCTTTDTDLLVRNGHGTGYSVIGSIPSGAQVTVTKASGEGQGHWAHVQYEGISGYASMAYLQKLADLHQYEVTVVEPTCTEQGYTQHTCLRCATSYRDAYVHALGHEYDRWQTTANGQQRTCARCGAVQTRKSENSVFGMVITDNLHVRAGAGTGYATVKYLQTGDKVELVQWKVAGGMLWGKMEDGWVSMEYVQATWSEDDTRWGVVVGTDRLNVRQLPSTSSAREGQLSRNTRVEIQRVLTVDGAQWAKIADGWVSMQYIRLEALPQPDPQPGQPSQIGTVINVDLLNIRKSASLSASIVGQLKRGQQVQIYETVTVDGALWGRIDSGWISMKYIRLEASVTPDPEPTPTPQPSQIGTVINVDLLNIRKSASLSASIVGQLKRGQQVQIYETVTVDGALWGRIDSGWISMKYIRLETSVTPNPEPIPTPSQIGTVVNVDILNIRQSTSTTSAKVGQLKRGQQVQILEIVTVGGKNWGRIDGGWVLMDYIRLEESFPRTMTVTGVDILNIRQSTSTTSAKVGQLKRGQQVQILEIVTVGGKNWGRIDGGWVLMDYLV